MPWTAWAARQARRAAWDLSALLNAADPRATQAERHLWLVRLLEWLRHRSATPAEDGTAPAEATPTPLLRLRHLLNVLDRHPAHREQVQALIQACWAEIDGLGLLADFGFARQRSVQGELGERLQLRLLPGTPDTADLAALFPLLFSEPDDAHWVEAMDDALLARVERLLGGATLAGGPPPASAWQGMALDAIVILSLQVAAAGLLGPVRQRMDPQTLVDRPFDALPRSSERLRDAVQAGDAPAALLEAQYLRGLLDAARRAAGSVRQGIEDRGISVDLLFEMDQLAARARRIDALLATVLEPAGSAGRRRAWALLLHGLIEAAGERRSIRALFSRQYSMLARRIAERSAETGEHYITRDRAEWLAMLRKALGGGAVIAGTTFAKFWIVALGLSAFWGGFWAGMNYAISFVIVHLAHWTVATKQPAMTAPALAARMGELGRPEGAERVVDEVAHLIRSQVAGIVGNLVMVAPLVLAVQLLGSWLGGHPLVPEHEAQYVLKSLTLLGPTLAYAAFTGVLLFASSLVAGWAENWFVLHRLDSAIRWHPRALRWLGAGRASRWAAWWRANISGLAANVSLGLMLGLVPALALFFGLPLEVRHVTLSTGQIAAALGSFGSAALQQPAFWWCVAAIPLTGLLNVGVSFALAFRVALRSRGLRVRERASLWAALRARLRRAPMSFLWPPRESPSAGP